MTANAFIGNVFPLSAGLLPTLINSMALGPMLWMCFMGVLLWKKSGQPWVVAPEETAAAPLGARRRRRVALCLRWYVENADAAGVGAVREPPLRSHSPPS